MKQNMNEVMERGQPWTLLFGEATLQGAIVNEPSTLEWPETLCLLRKLHRHTPLNQVVIAFSVEELLATGTKQLNHRIEQLRHKLQDLNRELGILVPLNFVITHCEGIPGFSHFALEQAHAINNGDYASVLTHLKECMSAELFEKLARVNDLSQRHLILGFSRDYEQVLKRVSACLDALTDNNHYPEKPTLSGIYFSASPEQPLRLLAPKPLVKNARQAKRAHYLKMGTVLASVLLWLSLGGLLWSGYELQEALYLKEDALYNGLGKDPAANLQKIHEHLLHLKTIESDHYWRYTLGINSVKQQIKANEAVFMRAFSQGMFKKSIQSLEQSILEDTRARTKDYAPAYDRLKTYLMMGNHEKLDPAFAASVLGKKETRPMLLTYLEWVKKQPSLAEPVTMNPAIIQAARASLYVPPDPKVLYQHLVSRGEKELGTISLPDLMGGKEQGLLSTQTPLPRMFTKKAFEQSVVPMMRAIAENAGTGDWVLQAQASQKPDKAKQKAWISAMRSLYFQDYATHWMRTLGSLHVKSFHSLDDAAAKMLRLQGPEGPLAQVIAKINENLSLEAAELQPYAKAVKSLSLEDYFAQLELVRGELTTLSTAADPLAAAEGYARKVLSETSQSTLAAAFKAERGLIQGVPDLNGALSAFLRSPLEEAWSAILDTAAKQIQQQWESEVVSVYNHSLRGKFPFAKTHTEAALDDLSSFFNPRDGIIPDFMKRVMSPYLKQHKSGWQEKEWMGRGIGFSSVYLRSLSQADTITQALFLKRSTEPSFSFYIQPVPVAGVEEMTIDVNGQEYRYRNEPEEWRRFNWPGEDSVIGARLYAVSHPKKQAAELEHEGVWGLFHLLSQARFIKQGGTQYLTEWDLRDKSGHPLAVKMRMKADKQSHVLDPRLLTEFKLPDKIRGK